MSKGTKIAVFVMFEFCHTLFRIVLFINLFYCGLSEILIKIFSFSILRIENDDFFDLCRSVKTLSLLNVYPARFRTFF